MHNLCEAKALLEAGGHSCVLYKDGAAHLSDKRGVAPLVDWLDEGLPMDGFSAADKIVGKAAAMLFVLAGVKAVYAPVMSRGAAEFLRGRGVEAAYGLLTEGIINRAGDGPCPMERAVAAIDDPVQALAAIKETQAALRAGRAAGR